MCPTNELNVPEEEEVPLEEILTDTFPTAECQATVLQDEIFPKGGVNFLELKTTCQRRSALHTNDKFPTKVELFFFHCYEDHPTKGKFSNFAKGDLPT